MTSKTCQPGHYENPDSFQEQDFTHFPGLADLRAPPPTNSGAWILHQENTQDRWGHVGEESPTTNMLATPQPTAAFNTVIIIS